MHQEQTQQEQQHEPQLQQEYQLLQEPQQQYHLLQQHQLQPEYQLLQEHQLQQEYQLLQQLEQEQQLQQEGHMQLECHTQQEFQQLEDYIPQQQEPQSQQEQQLPQEPQLQHQEQQQNDEGCNSMANGGGRAKRKCHVCENSYASGRHYGAYTCEACKAFFKRTVYQRFTYQCIGNPILCAANGFKRRACPKCRFERCLLLGMNPRMVRMPDASLVAQQPLSHQPVAEEPEAATPLSTPESAPAADAARCALLAIGQLPQGADLVEQLPPLLGNLADIEPAPIYIDLDEVEKAKSFDEQVVTGISLVTDQFITELVSWSKRLHGFADLSISDRVRLLQGNWIQLLTLYTVHCSVPYEGDLRLCANFGIPESRLPQFHVPRLDHRNRTLCKHVTALGLSRHEYLLLKAIFFMDTCYSQEWDCKQVIEQLQDSYKAELRIVCPDPARRGSLLLVSSELHSSKILALGYWHFAVHHSSTLPHPLLTEMLVRSLEEDDARLAGDEF